MKKRIVYRFTGKPRVWNGKSLFPGRFISHADFGTLPDSETIRQEIWVTDPQEVRYVTHQY